MATKASLTAHSLKLSNVELAGSDNDAGEDTRPKTRITVQETIDAGEEWRSYSLKYTHQHVPSVSNPIPAVSYRVRCDPGYHGPRCALACNPRQDKFGHYDCSENGSRTCLHGWTGKFCDTPMCLPGCHAVNGYCDQPNECKCRLGWQGQLCDGCIPYPGCQHGTCQRPWQCTCMEGWGGLFCNQDLKFCSNNRPCRNGATCRNAGLGSYTCSCVPGFSGTNCEIDLNGCPYTPCLNNGSCIYYGTERRCKCRFGFAGRHCQLSARTCDTNPCSNGGTCLMMGGAYRCECPSGYTGFNCDVNVDECQPNPCMNGGSCIDGVNGYRCSCMPGFTGQRCEVDRDECADVNPCLNGGQCVDRPNDFECRCRPGFVGALCQDDIDECLARPCANGATCRQLVNDFRCTCAPGFAGRYCTENLDECSSSPCRNGGTCVDGIAGFDCHCPSEFVGLVCETSVALLDGTHQRDDVEWRPVAAAAAAGGRPKGEFQSSPIAVSSSRSSKAKLRRTDSDGDDGAAGFGSVQPLLLVVSFGLALPIVFVVCAVAVWFHRRRMIQRLRLGGTSGDAYVQHEESLNNRRQVRSLVIDANCVQQCASRSCRSSVQMASDFILVDAYEVDKSTKNTRAEQYNNMSGEGQGWGQTNWTGTTANADHRYENILQCRNNIASTSNVSASTGSTFPARSDIWTTTVSGKDHVSSVCRDVIPIKLDDRRTHQCKTGSGSAQQVLACRSSCSSSCRRCLSSSTPMRRAALCHPHHQQHQPQEQERCRCCLLTAAAAAPSDNSDGFQQLNPNATGISELLELATEV